MIIEFMCRIFNSSWHNSFKKFWYYKKPHPSIKRYSLLYWSSKILDLFSYDRLWIYNTILIIDIIKMNQLTLGLYLFQLIQHKASVNELNEHGNTPLHYACFWNLEAISVVRGFVINFYLNLIKSWIIH